jgi:TolA-binding protein
LKYEITILKQESEELKKRLEIIESKTFSSKKNKEENNIKCEESSEDSNNIGKEEEQTKKNIDDANKSFEEVLILIKDKKKESLDKAVSKLKKIVESVDDESLSPHSYYLLGEIYFLKQEYEKSANYFATGYKKYPNSQFVSEILIKLANTLILLEKKQEAKVIIQDKLLKIKNIPQAIKLEAQDLLKKCK